MAHKNPGNIEKFLRGKKGKFTLNKVSPIASAIAGFGRGLSGKSIGSKAIPVTAGILRSKQLIKEAEASRSAIKTLKDAGATKEQLKKAKSFLRRTWGDYAIDFGSKTLTDSGLYLFSRAAGSILKSNMDMKRRWKRRDNK